MSAAPAEQVNILLVDDQPGKLMSFQVILGDLCENVMAVNSAREALDHLLRHEFAVVLVDVCMPELDGFELAAMMRAHPRYEKTAIIFVSGVHLTDVDRVKAYQIGAVDYVSVPVIPEILRAKVRVFIDLFRKTKQLERLNHELERRVASRTSDLEASSLRLRQSEERLRLALAAGRAGAWEWPASGAAVGSPEQHELLGLPPDAPAPDRAAFLAMVHPEDRRRIEQELEHAMEAAGPFEFECRVVRPRSGRVVWIHSTGRADCASEGGPRIARGLHQDITQRKRAEDMVRRQAELLEQSTEGVLVWTRDDGILYWNSAASELYGFSAVDALGRAPADLLASQFLIDRAEVLLMLDREGEWQGEIVQTTKSGRRLVVETRLRVVREGERSVVLETGRDVTARHEAERALRENEQRLRIALEAGKMGWWDYDVATEGLAWSESLTHAMGAPPSEGQALASLVALVHPDDRAHALAVATRLIQEGGSDAAEVRLVQADGTIRWALIAGQVITDDHGAPLRIIGVALDITDRKRAEHALLEADRRKDEFLAMLAHELRNPLAPIRTAAYLLKRPEITLTARTRAQDMIEVQVEHLVRLIDDLLDVSRISRGLIHLQREPMALGLAVTRAVEVNGPQLSARGHDLHLNVAEPSPMVFGDLTRLIQVFGNVINNAIKYTPEKGTISVSLDVEGPEAVFTVTDSGIGIPDHMLGRIFELFTQVDRRRDRKQGGLGIGLALVRRLVEKHGGKVTANSAGEGLGTSIVVRLPIHAGSSRIDAEGDQPNALVQISPRRVLVVDDNVDAADAVALLLQAAGHDVRTAHDGLEALEVGMGFEPEVVFLDLGMPRLNGYDTARRMRTLPWGRTVRLIALSGWGQAQDRERTAESGFDVHLIKPVGENELFRVLSDAPPRVRTLTPLVSTVAVRR